MRILIVTESFYPNISGHAIMSERLAVQMAQRGHTIHVIAPSHNRSFFEQERKGYIVHRIPSWPNPFRKGFRMTILPSRFIRRVFQEFEPDIVHCHDPASLCQNTAKIANQKGIPVVVTNHLTFDYAVTYFPYLKPFHPLMIYLFRLVIYRFYNHCTILTVPTQTVKEMLISKQLKIPIRVISNGVDVSRFSMYYRPGELLRRFHLNLAQPMILYVGRLDSEKNVGLLIEALAEVLAKKDLRLLIVGHGKDQEELKERAKELGVQKAITWIPRLDSQSPLLNQLYQVATIFCIPSLMETESMVTMEAMASGLPVLASDVGALPELVKNGQNGYLLPTDAPRLWAEKILHLLANEEQRQQMGALSIERITDRDLGKTLDLFEGLYQEVIKDSHLAAGPVLG